MTMEIEKALAEERERVGRCLVPLASKLGWCGDVMLAWRVIYGDDVPEPRDADGVSLEGWTLAEGGRTEYTGLPDYRTERPVRPDLSCIPLWQAPSSGTRPDFTWISDGSIDEVIERAHNAMFEEDVDDDVVFAHDDGADWFDDDPF